MDEMPHSRLSTHVQLVPDDELPGLFHHFQSLYPGGVADLSRMRSWLRVNPLIVYKVLDVAEENEKIPPTLIGLFETIPLSDSGIQSFDSGCRIGLSIVASDILAAKEVPRAFYIGSVGSLFRDRIITAAVLKAFYQHINAICRDCDTVFYARPVTQEGKNLIDKFNFHKLQSVLADFDSFWRVTLPKGHIVPDSTRRLSDIDFSSFLDDLVLECSNEGRSWTVKKAFRLNLPRQFSLKRVVVNEGFATDFASIPRLFWTILPPTGRYGKAAVIHDYLYREVRYSITRKEADAIFLYAMRQKSVGRITFCIMWAAVRTFGFLAWKKR
jgi:hypothetical protein